MKADPVPFPIIQTPALLSASTAFGVKASKAGESVLQTYKVFETFSHGLSPDRPFVKVVEKTKIFRRESEHREDIKKPIPDVMARYEAISQ